MEKSLFENLCNVLKRFKLEFFKGFVMVLISNFLLIFNPLVFRQAVMAVDPNSAIEPGVLTTFFQRIFGAWAQSTWSWAPVLLLIALISALFKYSMRVTFISVSRAVEEEVRSKLFARIQAQSMAFFDRHGIGELLSRLTNDISLYRDVLGPGIMYPLFFLTLVLPGLAALFLISYQLAALSMIPLFAIPIVNFLVRGKMYSLSRGAQTVMAGLSNLVQEHYSSIRIIKAYAAESAMEERFKKLSGALRDVSRDQAVLQGLLFPFFTFLTKAITIVLVLFSGFLILKAWSDLSPADFVSFMWIQSYIFFPVLMLGWLIPVYERGRAAYDRLVEIYTEPVEVRELPGLSLRIPSGAGIRFEKLTFTYPTADKPALKNVTATIKGGAFVGITGPVGAGKTTLFRLLTREYEVAEGMIFIGGHEIHEFPLQAFHAEMVTVEQVPFLFARSIAENVRFGRQMASREEIELVARFADFHDTVLDFPEQYETIVGERGVRLSGGQKQRLAMARAFLVNRSILLLDDIFSAVDAATEKRIFEAMKQNFKGKTLLLVTHRLSLLEQMDQVLYMDGGEVIEQGTHKELLEMQGHYAALVELQRLGGEL